MKKLSLESFESIFDTHWQALYAYAFRVMNSQETAEDLTQEVFSDLWEHREQLDIHTSLKAYLFGSLRKKILTNFRDKGIQEKHLQFFKQLIAEQVTTPLDAVESQDLLDTLLQKADQLPAREKEVFIMNQVKGFSVREIAEQSSTSEQTVRNQVNKALHKLQPFLLKLLS